MRENFVETEQSKSENINASRLTAEVAQSYAGYGEVFMAEDVGEKRGAEAETKAAQNEAATNTAETGHVDWESRDPKEKQEIEKKIEEYGGDWGKLEAAEGNNVDIIELTKVLKANGVTLEQFLKDRKFYEKNLHLFKKKNAEEEKKARNLIREWEEYFREVDEENKNSEATSELNRKWYLVHTLAISAGLSPHKFAKQYKWSAYFDAKAPEKPLGILKTFAKELVKDVVTQVVTDLVLPDVELSADSKINAKLNLERRKAFARVLWGVVNDNKRRENDKTGRKESVDEAKAREFTQEVAIANGIPPELNLEVDIKGSLVARGEKGEIVIKSEVLVNSMLDDKQRIAKAALLLGRPLGEREEKALLEAHDVGKGEGGVYFFTNKHLGEKIKILEAAGFNKQEWKDLIRLGLAGASGEGPFESYEELRKKMAEAIILGLTPDQQRFIEGLSLRLQNLTGFSIDFNDPIHMTKASEIARRHTPGAEISDESIREIYETVQRKYDQALEELNKPEEVSPERIRVATEKWEHFKEERANAGDPVTEDENRKIEGFKAQGIDPDQATWESAPARRAREEREELEKLENAWALHWRDQGDSGKPATEADRLMTREAINRGQWPPNPDYVNNTPEPTINEHVEEDAAAVEESIKGHLTMWEQLQELHGERERQQREGLRQGERPVTPSYISQVEQGIFERDTPNSVEDLAWLIGKSAPDLYGVMSDNPVWEVVYTRDGPGYKAGQRVTREEDLYKKDITEGRVHRGNFILWMRDRMYYMHDDEPDDVIDFEQQITIERGGFTTIHFGSIRKNPGRYMRREKISRKRRELELRQKTATGEELDRIKRELADLPPVIMNDLLEEIKRETWAFSETRKFDLHYRARCGVKDEFVKMMTEIFARSPFTKTVWDGRSLFDWVFTMDQVYGTGDHKVGAAILGAYQIYYNLTDRERLRELMGTHADKLLSLQGLKDARDKAAGITVEEEDGREIRGVKEKIRVNGEQIVRFSAKSDDELKNIGNSYYSNKKIEDLFVFSEKEIYDIRETYADINKRGFDTPGRSFRVKEGAKDKDGNPLYEEIDENGNPLINEWRFIRDLNINKSPQELASTESILKNAIQNYIEEKYKLKLGSGKTDEKNVEFAALFASTMNRWTGAQARNNQGAGGYDAWVALMKTRTYRRKYSEQDRAEAFGNPYTVDMIRSLVPDLLTGITTDTAISAEDRKRSKYADRSDKATKSMLEVLDEMHEAWDQAGTLEEKARFYEQASKQQRFPANTLRQFSLDQIRRGMEIYGQVIDSKEIRLEKFTRIDPIKGVTFERDQFQEAVQDKFLKPMRYMLSTWKQVDFGMMVRDNRGNESNTGWAEISMAEKMFGQQLLDIPEFWEKVPEGTPGAQKYKTRTKDGEFEDTWRMPNKISGKEVNDNRIQLIKQLAKTRIAAELYSHRDIHSSDPRYDFRFYETVIMALERLPGGIDGDEFDLKSAKTILDPDKRYFSKEDIVWIRKNSSTERWRLFGWAFLTALLWDGMFKGGLEAIKKGFEYEAKGITA